MANALYDKGREGFLAGDIDWDANTIKIVLIDEADDTIDLAVDDNLDDRAAGSRVATSAALSSKTATNGVADAADVTFSAVGEGTLPADAIAPTAAMFRPRPRPPNAWAVAIPADGVMLCGAADAGRNSTSTAACGLLCDWVM